MFGIVISLAINSLTTLVVGQTALNNNPVGTNPSPFNFCSVYEPSPCCPALEPVEGSIQFGFENQPFYESFAPASPTTEIIDNICYTMERLPDDNNTFQLFIATVYVDGSYTIDTFIDTQKQLGTYTVGSPQCTFEDIVFEEVADDNLSCNVGLLYRCVLYGECPRPANGVTPVFGITFVRQRLPVACWNIIDAAILSNGFPEQDYYSFPMNLPSRCVLPQVCTLPPNIHLFQRAVDFRIYSNQNCQNY